MTPPALRGLARGRLAQGEAPLSLSLGAREQAPPGLRLGEAPLRRARRRLPRRPRAMRKRL